MSLNQTCRIALVVFMLLKMITLGQAQETAVNTDPLPPQSPIYGAREAGPMSATNSEVVPEGYRLYDDMLLPVSTIKSASPLNVQLWPSGILPLQFAKNVSSAQKQAFFSACAWWGRVANIKCQARQGESTYLLVQSSNVNSSHIGRVGAGGQIINIYNWDVPGIMAHEIGHALGLTHEHMRKDRDQFVRVVTDNIAVDNRHNFDRIDNIDWSYYDFDSIMHYGSTAFSINGKATIIPIDGAQHHNMGQRDGLSRRDELAAKKLYGALPGATVVVPDFSNVSLGAARYRARIDHGLAVIVASGPEASYTEEFTICESIVHEPHVLTQSPASGTRVPLLSKISVVTVDRAEVRYHSPPKGRICP